MKIKKIKKFIRPALAIIFAIVIVVPVLGSDLEDQIDEANSKQDELNQQVADSEARLEELQNSKADLEAMIAELDAEIENVNGILEGYAAEAVEKQTRILELEDQIATKEVEIQDKYDKMKMRIKYMYENLNTDYTEAIFTSTSFGEFYEKIEYIKDLNSYDRKMMNELAVLKADLDADKAEVEQQLADVQALEAATQEELYVLDELEVMRSGELSQTLAAISEEEEELQALNKDLEENAQQIADLSAQYDEWVRQQQESNDGDWYTGGGEEVYSGGTPVDGTWMWPVPGYTYISSGFGYRDGGEWHAGIDIPAPEGTPIYACDDGMVVMARSDAWCDTGIYTVIYHANGSYSEYMHQCELCVYVGQIVSRGQLIGYVGNTGESYGSHLHLSCGWGSAYWSNRTDPTAMFNWE